MLAPWRTQNDTVPCSCMLPKVGNEGLVSISPAKASKRWGGGGGRFQLVKKTAGIGNAAKGSFNTRAQRLQAGCFTSA